MIHLGIFLFLMLYGSGLAQDQTYVISAPKFIRAGASEQVVIQAYGYTQEFSVTISMKSYPDKKMTYAFGTVQLTPANHFQGSVTLTVQPKDLRTDDPQKRVESIYLEAASPHFTRQKKMLLTYDNGFLFIQTDKPIYTPDQSVKVRVYSLNEELRPARRAAVLTFVDPGGAEVDIIREDDATGIISFPEFKIPPYPKFGIWTIIAKYDKEFITSAIAKFQVKEYAMPRFSVEIIPENGFISSQYFERFKITIQARYFYKKKLSEAEVYVRFGIVQGARKTMLPKSLRLINMEDGIAMLYFNSKEALREMGYSDLSEVDGATLYLAASVLETGDGHSEDGELTTVKYALSPYKLDLIATPLFMKPGLPYFIKARVRDMLDISVGNVPVLLTATALNDQMEETKLIQEGSEFGSGVTSSTDGTTIFTVTIPSDAKVLEFKITTADPSLSDENQARETYEAKSYISLNGNYLYIDWASDHRVLHVGESFQIKVHPASHYIDKILHYSYLILSRGKIISYGTQEKIEGLSYQGLNLQITEEMVPSARLLVYYIVTGEGTAELVADSVWLNVQQKCGNNLEVRILKNGRVYRPRESVSLSMTSESHSLVALSALDKAIYGVTGSKQKPMEKALLKLEKSDLGCGAGGGENNVDVFRMAGLTFLTNANADDPREKDETCTAIIRSARSLKEDIEKLVAQFQNQQIQKCCRSGAEPYPFPQTCQQRIKRIIKGGPRCIYAFRLCCEFAFKRRLNDTHKHLLLGRNAFNALLDVAPEIRSFFPESWLWEVHPVQRSKTLPVTLPDSLTTWEIQGVSISDKGICVADTLEVEVVKEVFVNVHIPYSVVRGEQIELKATIYNYRPSRAKYCLKLSVQKGICLFGAANTLTDSSQVHTCSHLKDIQSSSMVVESFKVLPLELGLLSVNLTLHSDAGNEMLVKTLRVVPEGIRRESYDGGTLDPQGVYGTVVRQKEFAHKVPRYIVPKMQLEKTLSIKGNLLGDVIQAAVKPEALKLLTNLPQGSAETELMNTVPVFYVYDYLERSKSWDIFGLDRTSAEITMLRKMKRGIISILSFQTQDYSYSMWKDGEASTWITAFILKVFGQVRRYMPDQFGTACQSLTWLIDICQMDDGSFREVSDYKPIALQGTLRDQQKENSLYLTAFTLMAFSDYKKACPFQKFADAENRAVNYLLQNIASSQNTFVLAIVTYALTQAKVNHPDLHSAYSRLKNEAQVKGNPPIYRFWKETPIKFDASIPSKGNAKMVETTAYALLSILRKGDHNYAKPVMKWLTEEQRFGGGFYSTQDTIIALECLTEYSILIRRLELDMNIKASYKSRGDFHTYRLTSSHYIGKPVDASLSDDIEVRTGSNTGTAAVTLRSVYYVSSVSEDTCDFQLKINVTRDEKKYYLSFNEIRLLVACAKYKPRRRTGQFSSPHAVIDVSLPNGLEANTEDLSLLSNSVDQLILNYEIRPDGHVIMQVDSIPGNEFLCVGFRTIEIYRVGMPSPGTFSVYDYHDPEKRCTIFYNAYGEESLVKLCEGSECKCMEAECGHMQPRLDTSITLDTRKEAACQQNIAYVYKVVIKSSKEEGSFVKYNAILLEPYKLGVTFAEKNAEIVFIKKSSCTDVQLNPKENYLIMGKEALKTGQGANARYQYPLDDSTWIEWWPSSSATCGSCQAFTDSLEEFADDLFLIGC